MVDRPFVVFGAGNIGRGLLAELAGRESGSLIFVEAIRELAERLRRAKTYQVHLTGALQETIVVQDYKVVDSTDRAAVSAAIESAGLVAVAVGSPNLAAVAATLAPALAARDRDAGCHSETRRLSLGRGISAPGSASGPCQVTHDRTRHTLPILVCENQHGADHVLAAAILEHGGPADTFACIATSIERMVRPAADSLDLYAEAGQSLYVDGAQWEAAAAGRHLPEGFVPVGALDAYYARKLYTNNAGHALLAYLGRRHGHRTIAEAAGDPELAVYLRQLLAAAAKMLILDFGLDSADIERHVEELVTVRFANEALADPICRVARDPIRKLGPDDRLVGLLRRLDRHGLPTDAVCRTIAAALCYYDENDDQSRELAALIREGGPALVLQRICGMGPEESGFKTIVTYFNVDKP